MKTDTGDKIRMKPNLRRVVTPTRLMYFNKGSIAATREAENFKQHIIMPVFKRPVYPLDIHID